MSKKDVEQRVKERLSENGPRVLNSVRNHYYDVSYRSALTDAKKAGEILHLATETLQAILDVYEARNPKPLQPSSGNNEYAFKRLFGENALPQIAGALKGEVDDFNIKKLLKKESDPKKANTNRNTIILNAAESGVFVSFSVPYLHAAKLIAETAIEAAYNNHVDFHIPAERLRSLLWVVDTFNDLKHSYYGHDGLVKLGKNIDAVDSDKHSVAALFIDKITEEVKGIKDFLNNDVTNNKYLKDKAYLNLTVPNLKVKVSNIEAVANQEVDKGRVS